MAEFDRTVTYTTSEIFEAVAIIEDTAAAIEDVFPGLAANLADVAATLHGPMVGHWPNQDPEV